MAATESDSQKYEEFLKTFKNETMQILKKTLPVKVMEITAALESDKFALSRRQEFRDITFDIPLLNKQNPESQKGRPCTCCCGLRPLATHEMIPDSSSMKELWQILSPFLFDLAEITNKLQAWLGLHAPRYEDGDNVGVEIQEKVMTVLKEVEKSCLADILSYRMYHGKRGGCIEYALKFPNVGDCLEEIRQLDEEAFLHIRCKMLNTRRLLILVQDTVQKNMAKLIKPKSIEVESLYSM